MSERSPRRHARAGGWLVAGSWPLAALLAACGGDARQEQEAAPPSASLATNLTLDAQKCGYEPNASIFDKPAEMWTAQSERSEGPYLNLAAWKLKSGEPVQFNLGVESGGADLREISTVVGGTTKGTGTATITPQGAGGVIAIDGTDASGAALKLTITCARFDPIAEEGGR
jgi:hypothetical protein